MRISILGAGWLGLSLGKALILNGHEVKGSTTSVEKIEQLQNQGLEPFLINLNTKEALPEEFFLSDLLVITLPPGRRDPEVFKNYTARIDKVIEALGKSTIKYIMYTSSSGVYGNQEGLITEDAPLLPTTSSAQAVKAAELMLQKTGLPLTILRLAGLVGGNRQPGRFLAGKSGLPDGEAPVNLVHREDCIGLINAIIEQSRWNEIFNASADEHPSRELFYTKMALKLGLKPPQFIEGKKTKPYKIISNEKVKSVLGYTFKYSDPMRF